MSAPSRLDRLVVLSPFGVNPPRSREDFAVLDPARHLARAGVGVHLFGRGLRRFEYFRHFRSFVRTIEPNLVEERLVSPVVSLGLRRADPLGRKASELLRKRCAGADIVLYEGSSLFSFRAGNRPRVVVARRGGEPSEGEAAAWRDAEGVICLSERDRLDLADAYGDRDAVVIPVGVDTERHRPATPEERDAARRSLGVEDRHVVLYTGSRPAPNRPVIPLLVEMSERTEEDVLWVVAGSAHTRREQSPRILLTGPIRSVDPWLAAADCYVNPMAGAEEKTSTGLVHGLPVVTTERGAGEIGLEDGRHVLIRQPDLFAAAVERLRGEPDLAAALASEGRELIGRERSWAHIAERRRVYLGSVAGSA